MKNYSRGLHYRYFFLFRCGPPIPMSAAATDCVGLQCIPSLPFQLFSGANWFPSISAPNMESSPPPHWGFAFFAASPDLPASRGLASWTPRSFNDALFCPSARRSDMLLYCTGTDCARGDGLKFKDRIFLISDPPPYAEPIEDDDCVPMLTADHNLAKLASTFFVFHCALE